MKENLDFIPHGEVKIFTINDKGKRKNIFHKKNMILGNAKTIITKCIAGVNYHIDNIVAYNSASILASAQISTITYPTFNSVEFTAIFDYLDWDPTNICDELRLTSSIGGDFSQLTNITILKNNSQQLGVVWKITFNDCPVIPIPGGDFNDDFNNDFDNES